MDQPQSEPCQQPDQGPASLCSVIYGFRGEGEPLEALLGAIGQGADVDAFCCIVERTPLMLCAQKGWLECVQALLAAGADPMARDEYGRDALMLALIARKQECARALAPISDLLAFDAEGRCPLALAALHLPHRADLDLLYALWRPGLEMADDYAGFNALDWAMGNGMAVFAEFKALLRALAESTELACCSEAAVPCSARAWI